MVSYRPGCLVARAECSSPRACEEVLAGARMRTMGRWVGAFQWVHPKSSRHSRRPQPYGRGAQQCSHDCCRRCSLKMQSKAGLAARDRARARCRLTAAPRSRPPPWQAAGPDSTPLQGGGEMRKRPHALPLPGPWGALRPATHAHARPQLPLLPTGSMLVLSAMGAAAGIACAPRPRPAAASALAGCCCW